MHSADYAQIFDQRGHAYDRAMRVWPDVRREEFAQVISRARLRAGDVIADVPAGGGYLRGYVPSFCTVLEHEPSKGFGGHGGAPPADGQSSLLPLPWPKASIDVVISLAGVHHIADKLPLFSAIFEVVKPGGRFVLSDVAADSAVAAFLDGFVGSHNSTGHDGIFLCPDALPRELESVGWRSLSCEAVDFCWRFPNRDAMGRFCSDLFDLQGVSVPAVVDAIQTTLGFHEAPAGEIAMNWSLLTVTADRQ